MRQQPAAETPGLTPLSRRKRARSSGRSSSNHVRPLLDDDQPRLRQPLPKPLRRAERRHVVLRAAERQHRHRHPRIIDRRVAGAIAASPPSTHPSSP